MQKDYFYFSARLVTFAISLFFFAVSIDDGRVPNSIGFGALGGAIMATGLLFVCQRKRVPCDAAN